MSASHPSHSPTQTNALAWPSKALKSPLVQLLFYLAGLFTSQLLSVVSREVSAALQRKNAVSKPNGRVLFNKLPEYNPSSNISPSFLPESYSQSHHSLSSPSLHAVLSNASFLGTYSTSNVFRSNVLVPLNGGNIPSDTFYWLSICLTITFVGLQAFRFIKSSVTFRIFWNENACLPMRVAPNPFPWKLRRYFELSKIDANLLDDYLLKKFQANGLTHGLATIFTKRVKAVATIEPLNFQAVLATKFDDWERPKFRAGAAKPFLKVGILTLVRSCLALLLFTLL
jgi:hypothetical protein